MGETKDKLDADLDALFALSLAEFTGARNALAAQLKRSGRGDEAGGVKSLVKPPVSAWAVNQLYWKHRKEFDRLIATAQNFRQAQATQLSGKDSDVRGPLEARREALSELSRLAAALLNDAGHNPTPDTMRRIASTLEAMSVSASLFDSPRPGRLTADLDPPGFESLAAVIPGVSMRDQAERPAPVSKVREDKEPRQAKIAAAKSSLQLAERALSEARAKAVGADVALKRANAGAKEAEKLKREAEERLQRARAASEEAAKAVEDAEQAVEKAAVELRSIAR